MFDTIVNPVTNRQVKLNSRLGKKILENYKKISGQTGGLWKRTSGNERTDCGPFLTDHNNKRPQNIPSGVMDIMDVVQEHFIKTVCKGTVQNDLKLVNFGSSGFGSVMSQECSKVRGGKNGLFIKCIVAKVPKSIKCERNFDTDPAGESLGILELTQAIKVLMDTNIMNQDGNIDIDRFPFISSYLGFIISSRLMQSRPTIFPKLIGQSRTSRLTHKSGPIPFISTNLLNSLSTSERNNFLDKISIAERITRDRRSEYALIFQENLGVNFVGTNRAFMVDETHNLLQKIESIKGANEIKLRLRAYLYLLYSFASGLKSIHDKRVIHNDIKPDNISGCLESDQYGEYIKIKLIDLGTLTRDETSGIATPGFDDIPSALEDDGQPNPLNYIPIYDETRITPTGQVIWDKKIDHPRTFQPNKKDIYAFGITACYLLRGLIDGHYTPKIPPVSGFYQTNNSDFVTDIFNIIRACLKAKRQERPNANDIILELERLRSLYCTSIPFPPNNPVPQAAPVAQAAPLAPLAQPAPVLAQADVSAPFATVLANHKKHFVQQAQQAHHQAPQQALVHQQPLVHQQLLAHQAQQQAQDGQAFAQAMAKAKAIKNAQFQAKLKADYKKKKEQAQKLQAQVMTVEQGIQIINTAAQDQMSKLVKYLKKNEKKEIKQHPPYFNQPFDPHDKFKKVGGPLSLNTDIMALEQVIDEHDRRFEEIIIEHNNRIYDEQKKKMSLEKQKKIEQALINYNSIEEDLKKIENEYRTLTKLLHENRDTLGKSEKETIADRLIDIGDNIKLNLSSIYYHAKDGTTPYYMANDFINILGKKTRLLRHGTWSRLYIPDWLGAGRTNPKQSLFKYATHISFSNKSIYDSLFEENIRGKRNELDIYFENAGFNEEGPIPCFRNDAGKRDKLDQLIEDIKNKGNEKSLFYKTKDLDKIQNDKLADYIKNVKKRKDILERKVFTGVQKLNYDRKLCEVDLLNTTKNITISGVYFQKVSGNNLIGEIKINKLPSQDLYNLVEGLENSDPKIININSPPEIESGKEDIILTFKPPSNCDIFNTGGSITIDINLFDITPRYKRSIVGGWSKLPTNPGKTWTGQIKDEPTHKIILEQYIKTIPIRDTRGEIIDFMENRIRRRSKARDIDYYTIYISDSGTGFNPDESTCLSDDNGCVVKISGITLNRGEFIEIKQPDFNSYNFTGTGEDKVGELSIMGLYKSYKEDKAKIGAQLAAEQAKIDLLNQQVES